MTALDLTGYSLTFDEEFNNRSISQTGAGTTWADIRPQWRYDANSDIGFGNSFFVDAASGYDPFSVQGGVLSITAVPYSSYPGSWESGLITTQGNFSQTYGYFEVRADYSNLPGAWDAFWLLPDQPIPDPNNAGHWQELDVVEHYGSFDKGIYSGIHTTDPAPNLNWQNDLQVYSELSQPGGFHTYGVDWEKDTISFYVDGQLMGSKPTPSDMHGPMYLLADLATQDDPNNNANVANVPITSSIDYIRVYSSLATGVIGPPTTSGSTSLTEVGNQYYFYSDGSGPSLKVAGAAVVAGQFGSWAPIAAEQTASGYEVAWKDTNADQYSVWSTDSNGNYLSSSLVMSGTSTALESFETSFHQDLNGDGVIGPPTTTIGTSGSIGPPTTTIGASGSIGPQTTMIGASGSTSLTEVGNQYYLHSDGSGPSLKVAGAAVVAGQFGSWSPIAAEQTASGYEVAWKDTSADQYSVWSTDSNGNYLSSSLVMSGTSTALESFETSFHRDLNCDGVIGVAVAANKTLELAGAESSAVTFNSSTGSLKLDEPSTFTGQIVGFNGNGTLSGSDQIDLTNLTYNSSVQSNSTFDSSTGLLTVSNGTTVDLLHFVGSYSPANFKFASDGLGGTVVYDPPIANQTIRGDRANDATIHITGNSMLNDSTGLHGSQVIVDSGATLTLNHLSANGSTIINNGTVNINGNSTVSIAAGAGQDNFVFSPNFGQATITHYTPGTDTLQINHEVFASIDALFAAAHDDPRGNAVIMDAAHDTITIQNVTTAQLHAHQGDFHLV